MLVLAVSLIAALNMTPDCETASACYDNEGDAKAVRTLTLSLTQTLTHLDPSANDARQLLALRAALPLGALLQADLHAPHQTLRQEDRVSLRGSVMDGTSWSAIAPTRSSRPFSPSHACSWLALSLTGVTRCPPSAFKQTMPQVFTAAHTLSFLM